MHNIAVFVGSLRAESFNRAFARALERLAGERFRFHYVEIGDLPMYNDDLWKDPPAPVTRLKADIAKADAILFVTPEYNRSVPPLIVNAIAWGSRPFGKNAWAHKPCALAGVSNGNIGTAVAQSHLRSMAVILGLHVLSAPEVYFTMKPETLDDAGAFADAGTRKFLDGFLGKFAAWIDRLGPVPAKG
jgi:chromate reductase